MRKNKHIGNKNWDMVNHYGFIFHMRNEIAIRELHEMCRRMQSK